MSLACDAYKSGFRKKILLDSNVERVLGKMAS